MSPQPLNAHDIATTLGERSHELGKLVDELDAAERDAVNRREDYTLAYSRAFLSAEGSMDIRRHTATVETHDARIAAELAETAVRGLRRRVDTIRTRIDIGRSLGAAVRAEVSLGGMGQGS